MIGVRSLAASSGSDPARRLAVAVGGLVGGGALILLMAGMGVPLVLGGLVALAALLLLLAYPFAALLLGVFVLYTNLPAGAAERGLIPTEATVLVGALFVPALLRHLVARREELRLDRTFALMVAFLAVMLVSGLFAVEARLAFSYIGTYALEGMLVFLLVVNTVRDRAALNRVLPVVVGAAAFLATLSVYQEITGNYHHEFLGLAQRTTEGMEHRARGPTDDANRYGQILLVAGSFALALLWTPKGGKRAAAIGTLGLIVAAILLTYSRGTFVTLVFLVLVLGVLRIIPRHRLALVLLVGVVLTPVAVPGYVDRIHSIAGAVGLFSDDAAVDPDGPTRGRTTEMLAATLAFTEHPLLGVGPGQYVPHYSVSYMQRPEIAFRQIATPRRAHNLYVELAAETGAVGLLVFLAIPGLLLRDLWRIRRKARESRPELEGLAAGFMLAILAYLGSGMFLHLSFQRYYWLLVGLAASAVWIVNAELREEEEDRLVPTSGRASR